MAQALEDNLDIQKIAKMTEREKRRLGQLASFAETLIIVEGKKGSGKSQTAVALAYKLKEAFNLPVVADQRLKSKFGEYTFLNEQDFVNSISKVSNIAKNTTQESVDLAVEWSLHKEGITLANAVVVLDEAYRYFDCRTPNDKLVRIFGYFIAQMRHYKTTVILCCPSKRYLDRRVRDQMDIHIRASFNKKTQYIHSRVLNYVSGESFPLRFYGPDYFDMYDSWGAISLRSKILNMKGQL